MMKVIGTVILMILYFIVIVWVAWSIFVHAHKLAHRYEPPKCYNQFHNVVDCPGGENDGK